MAGHGYDEVTDLGLAYKIDAGVTKTKSCKQLKCIHCGTIPIYEVVSVEKRCKTDSKKDEQFLEQTKVKKTCTFKQHLKAVMFTELPV